MPCLAYASSCAPALSEGCFAFPLENGRLACFDAPEAQLGGWLYAWPFRVPGCSLAARLKVAFQCNNNNNTCTSMMAAASLLTKTQAFAVFGADGFKRSDFLKQARDQARGALSLQRWLGSLSLPCRTVPWTLEQRMVSRKVMDPNSAYHGPPEHHAQGSFLPPLKNISACMML
jgi:hypothetical protein